MRRAFAESLRRFHCEGAPRSSLTSFVCSSRSQGLPAFAWQSTQSFTTQEQQNTPSPSSGTNTTTSIDTPTSSPASDVPYPNDPYAEIRQFSRFTDIYLGGLWNRLEKELGKIENESEDFDYDVQLTSGCMRVKLPDDAEVIICKSPQDQELKVESNLHIIYGGGGGGGGAGKKNASGGNESGGEGFDPREEASFKFIEEEGEFVNTDGGSVPLHQYLEDHLAKHLNVELDLEPQPGPHDKVYGADPT